MYIELYLFHFQKRIHPLLFQIICPPYPISAQSNGSAKQQSCLGSSGRVALMAIQGIGSGASVDIGGGGGSGSRNGGRGGGRRLIFLACIGVGPLTRWLTLRARGPGWQGGAAALTLLGSCWGQAADALARAACLWPRAKVEEGKQRSRAHPWMSVARMALAGRRGAALASFGSRQGWAANALACPAPLRPRAEVRGGQQLLLAAVLALQLCNK
jgi:hypothetical protein